MSAAKIKPVQNMKEKNRKKPRLLKPEEDTMKRVQQELKYVISWGKEECNKMTEDNFKCNNNKKLWEGITFN